MLWRARLLLAKVAPEVAPDRWHHRHGAAASSVVEGGGPERERGEAEALDVIIETAVLVKITDFTLNGHHVRKCFTTAPASLLAMLMLANPPCT